MVLWAQQSASGVQRSLMLGSVQDSEEEAEGVAMCGAATDSTILLMFDVSSSAVPGPEKVYRALRPCEITACSSAFHTHVLQREGSADESSGVQLVGRCGTETSMQVGTICHCMCQLHTTHDMQRITARGSQTIADSC